MKQQLSEKLVEILDKVGSGVEKAGDFVVEQLPDVAQQYLVYGKVLETTSFLTSLVGLLALPVLCYFFIKKANRTNNVGAGTIGVIAGLLTIPALLGVLANMSSFFLVWFAPKIYLLKGLARLIQ